MSGCRDSSFSLQGTEWIVGAIQLETRHTKQRAIQHAFKWNKSQFSPTAEAQRTLNRLCLSTIVSVCHLFLLSSDFISSANRLLTYKIVWLQYQGLNIFIDLRIFFLIFVFFPPSVNLRVLDLLLTREQREIIQACVEKCSQGLWPMLLSQRHHFLRILYIARACRQHHKLL